MAGAPHSSRAPGLSGGAPSRSVGLVIRTDLLNRFVDIDREAGTVTVEAGMRLGYLDHRLGAWGLALDSPGVHDGSTLGGALATAAHGSGGRFTSLAGQVVALDVMCADGTLLHCSADEEPDAFAAARVSLGALGIVTRVTMRVVPAFNVAARHDGRPLAGLVAGLAHEIAASDYFECAWLPSTDQVAMRHGDRTSAPPGGRGNGPRLAEGALSAAVGSLVGTRFARRWPMLVPPSVRLAALGGRRRYCDRSYRVLGAAPGRAVSGRQWPGRQWPGRPSPGTHLLVSEWALPRANVGRALAEVVAWHRGSCAQGVAPALRGPVRVTVSASDDAWMSAAYGRHTGYLSVTPAPGDGAVELVAELASLLMPLGGRPRLGSIHPLDAVTLAALYPRWDDWQAQRRRLDPQGRFADPTVNRDSASSVRMGVSASVR